MSVRAMFKIGHKSYPPFLYNFVRNCQSNSLVRVTENETQYPPIVDVSSEASILRHERQLVYDHIKALPTVEEKLLEVTTQFSKENRTFFIGSAASRYCGVPFQHYISRTHLIHGLPEKLQENNVDSLYEEIKPYLIQVVQSHYNNFLQDTKIPEDIDFKACSRVKKIAYDLITCFIGRLAHENEHLVETYIDYRPRISSYWWHGDFQSKPIKEIRQTHEADACLKYFLKRELVEKNRSFQYVDFPLYTVRTQNPLPPVVPHDDPFCKFADVRQYNYDPNYFGLPCFRTNLVKLPGFWPGYECGFPFLSFHSPENIDKLRSKIDHYDLSEIEDGFGIMSSFGWLLSHTAYQGFTPFHDITYPFVAQTVLTDGQDWNFYVYQLNTICFHGDVDHKDKRNLCWSSGKMRLFESVEDGELKGINDEVLKVLLKFFLNSPAIPEGIHLKPYLGSKDAVMEDKEMIKNMLETLYTNKPLRDDWKREVSTWVEIYKNHPNASPTPWVKMC